jgi:hypothetical protein
LGISTVTWDTSFFRNNETLLVQANYVNPAGAGPQAFQSSLTSNSWGHIAWSIQRDWLKGQDSNNLTLFISTSSGITIAGPVVMIATSLTPAPTPTPTPAPRGPALYIALPLVFAFIVLCLCGGFFLNRKHRHIGLGNVMGRRKGYGARQSRRQRLGLRRKTKAGPIALADHEPSTDHAAYHDLPIKREITVPHHVRNDSDNLGSLVGTPTEERHRGTNVFREELKRQEQERL